MKRILLVLGLILSFVAVNAQTAQQQPTAQERAHNQAIKLQKQLMLSDDQTARVEPVILARINEVDAIKADASKTDDQKRAATEQVRTAKDTELSAILTPDQYKKYQLLQERKAKSH
jgi:periplasmic protein CpxP/Spy